MTEYLVFKAVENGWLQVSAVQAKSSAGAIKEALSALNGDAEGKFVATPARSWKPVSVQPKTVFTLS